MWHAMNDNPKVVRFRGESRLAWSVEEVLRCAAEKQCDEMIVIGRLPNGQLYFDATHASMTDVNWVLDQIKLDLLGRIPAG